MEGVGVTQRAESREAYRGQASADDGHWTRGCYDDGNGGHCLVGALLHLGRQHRLPTAPAIGLLQDAMPRPGLPLVYFNDTRCGSVAELRSVILKARRLAHDDAERERATVGAKTWLMAQIEQKRATSAAPFAPSVLPPSNSLRQPRAGDIKNNNRSLIRRHTIASLDRAATGPAG